MNDAVYARCRAILERAPIVIWEQAGADVRWVSPYWRALLGIDEEAPTPTMAEIADSVHPDDRFAFDQCLNAISENVACEQRYRIVRRDGSVRHIWTRATPAPSAGDEEKTTIAFSLDVTDEHEAREQLLHAQRLESIGQLAGGIAHDFNNLLTVMGAQAAIAGQHLDDPARVVEALSGIGAAVERASTLTRQLLSFSRKQMLQPRVVDVNDVTSGVLPMLHRLIESDVEIDAKLAPTLPKVQIDPGALEQAIVNLVVNARDAMPDGGTVTITTRLMMLDDEHRLGQLGPHVLLTVEDTGIGMDETTRDRAFEPFFTTKASGRGTGLGLSIVNGIVKQSGGSISLASELGRGTALELYFPVAPTDAEDVVPHASAPSASPESPTRVRVLIVDDDARVRMVLAELLETAGHVVTVARSVAEAREHLAASDIDLVLSDLVVGDADGPSLRSARDARGAVPAFIYMSGYSHGLDVVYGEPFLQKPFGLQELSDAVAAALSRLPAG